MLLVEETHTPGQTQATGGRYGNLIEAVLSHHELPRSFPSRLGMGAYAGEVWQPFQNRAHGQAGRRRYGTSWPYSEVQDAIRGSAHRSNQQVWTPCGRTSERPAPREILNPERSSVPQHHGGTRAQQVAVGSRFQPKPPRQQQCRIRGQARQAATGGVDAVTRNKD